MTKFMIALSLLAFGSFAFAGALDVPAPLPTGGQPITYPYCQDGQTMTFETQNAVGRTVQVTRVCTNGRWFAKTNPKPLLCKEGSWMLVSVPKSANSDRYDNVTYYCHAGKWVKP
jgi:hypothetical protein